MSEILHVPKVELHVHLDGCARYETLYELATKKNLYIPGSGTFEDLKKNCIIREPESLAAFLKPYKFYNPYYAGDLEAIERLAYEFCEDSKRCNVIYSEVRYSPHKLVGFASCDKYGLQGLLDVTSQVVKGLKRGERDFGVKCKSILSGCSWLPHSIPDILKVCENFTNDVVGIDLLSLAQGNEEAPNNPDLISFFAEAKRRGYGTTIHAGEVSGPAGIKRAVELYQSHRVGHGYHVVQDEKFYKECLRNRVHFECCPWSSFLTAAVPFETKRHPIKQLADDGANFSINSDDTTLTGYPLDSDYSLVSSWGVTEKQLEQTNLNAARSCFLPEDEKKDLIKRLMEAYG
nr:PREDICTED: adenosine deaminase-like [Bemisia tabaci]